MGPQIWMTRLMQICALYCQKQRQREENRKTEQEEEQGLEREESKTNM